MEALRSLLAEKAPRVTNAPRKPREGTKQEAVLTLLRRTEGATIAQIMETTSWAGHTCRGFLAGLKKKGIKVETLERVRMVGPNRDGAKGSYTIYALIPMLTDQNPCAQSRNPMDMMRQGWASSLFQASQQ